MSEDVYRWAKIAVAVVAAIIAVWTLIQKRAADNRNTWWDRMEWVLDSISDGSATKMVAGSALLPTVLELTLKTRPDKELARKINELNKELRTLILDPHDEDDQDDHPIESEDEQGKEQS